MLEKKVFGPSVCATNSLFCRVYKVEEGGNCVSLRPSVSVLTKQQARSFKDFNEKLLNKCYVY